MGRFLHKIGDAFRKGDLILLLLCVITTIYGCIIIASATNYMGTIRYVLIQIVAALIGIALYVLVSSVDADFFLEHRTALVVFNTALLLLLIPFGISVNGNKSWLDLPFLPITIQPAEICKLTYILIMASVMNTHQNRLSSVPSVMHMALHLFLLVGLNVVLSGDVGVSLIFVFIFIGMAFSGGVSLIWFLLVGGIIAVAAPLLWNSVMPEYMKLRIQALFDPSIDPNGTGVRYQLMGSLRSLTGGGFTGQGLFNGTRTQKGTLFAQYSDFVFASAGEELGYVGCAVIILLLVLIIVRCIWVGNRSQEFPRRLICYGAASALIFQTISNVGMCIGTMPVIGLTLPFISYGGSSIVSLYAMLGLVSGVYARPASRSHERYIRPPLSTYNRF